MSLHYLKLSDKYFDALKNGVKTFEIRKDDRGFRLGIPWSFSGLATESR